MTINREQFTEVFGDIVNEVRKVYDTTDLEKPYYLYGHPVDISNQLKCLDKPDTRFKKFPLICLLLDLPKTYGENTSYSYSVSPTVLVLTESNKEYDSTQRTTNTFKPVLYPIATELIKQVNNSQHLQYMVKQGYKYTWDDKYFWGKEGIKMKGYDGLIFNDYLDGIELNFFDLKVYTNSNC